ncbi:hypothetical protein QE152_g23604 [Popillia japonica]|uniref:Uncharacterized protein n=1 Tax=Popillia japonica TaxID=7064 RepID=A0AAW1KGT6_POPJA
MLFYSASREQYGDQSASREQYGDTAIGYVQLKRETSKCIVKCKICPEHKVNAKQYKVCSVIDEVQEIVDKVPCYDCGYRLCAVEKGDLEVHCKM